MYSRACVYRFHQFHLIPCYGSFHLCSSTVNILLLTVLSQKTNYSESGMLVFFFFFIAFLGFGADDLKEKSRSSREEEGFKLASASEFNRLYYFLVTASNIWKAFFPLIFMSLKRYLLIVSNIWKASLIFFKLLERVWFLCLFI